jgi:hypothetical protein
MALEPPSLPLEPRVGAAGAGLFVGCGAGAGWLVPVSLHGIPLLGAAAAGVATSLARADAALGGVAARFGRRSAAASGFGLGTGCGVALGYGWGAGVFLKPGALDKLGAALRARLPQGAAFVPPAPAPAPAAAPPDARGADGAEAAARLARVERELADLGALAARQQAALARLEAALAARPPR